MKKSFKTAFKKNAKRFFKKTFYRLLGRLIEIAALVAIGSAFGLKLVRY